MYICGQPAGRAAGRAARAGGLRYELAALAAAVQLKKVNYTKTPQTQQMQEFTNSEEKAKSGLPHEHQDLTSISYAKVAFEPKSQNDPRVNTHLLVVLFRQTQINTLNKAPAKAD